MRSCTFDTLLRACTIKVVFTSQVTQQKEGTFNLHLSRTRPPDLFNPFHICPAVEDFRQFFFSRQGILAHCCKHACERLNPYEASRRRRRAGMIPTALNCMGPGTRFTGKTLAHCMQCTYYSQLGAGLHFLTSSMRALSLHYPSAEQADFTLFVLFSQAQFSFNEARRSQNRHFHLNSS